MTKRKGGARALGGKFRASLDRNLTREGERLGEYFCCIFLF